MRLVFIFLLLVALVLIPFAIWGNTLEAIFSQNGAIDWMRQYGNWAWAVGIGLLIADLFLPIPGTVIMAGLGFIYGPILGGLVGSLGSFLSGSFAYILCRQVGEKAARWILGPKDFDRGQHIFKHNGGWIVAISRWLPVFPEVVACMAGLSRMPIHLFLIALACGSLPLGFTFAYIGSAGIENPTLALGLSAGLPVLLWLFAQYWLRRLASAKYP